MELKFLGTSAGIPTKERNVTSLILDLQGIRKALWMFDCGERTQNQILHSPVKIPKLEKIFITHLHGDHIFGLPGLLCSRSMGASTELLTLYGPTGIRQFMETAL
ncbi:Ribonuclease BN (fragment) [Xenorhabdus nematophila F1]